MPNPNMQRLPEALTVLTRPFDWNALLQTPVRIFPDAYSYFHRDLDAARGDGLVEDLLQSRLDQDRIKFAEDYADIILELTDLKDAYWFRRGVWKKETLPETIYPRQRDHSVHTAHNYLLGWYFFTRCRPITEQLRRSFESRNLEATFEPSFADSFGGLWCFVSLLHDIGYLFEGSVPDESTAGVDEGIRFGAEYASSYFTNIFWKECKLPRIDDRIIAQRLFGLSTVPIDATSPHSIISYLRDSGAATLGGALGIPDLPSDAFTLWATNYRHFGQREMAMRMENLTTALDAFVDQGLPGTTVRVLDHGVCGGLLLLKYSTLWFCLYEALNRAPPAADVRDEDVRNKLLTACNRRSPATHWWQSVVWATAAVALHNVQQTKGWPSEPLRLDEDPLAYLGILVDILQEWDRHSMRRTRAIKSDRRGINNDDVWIGNDGSRIFIEYRSRDATQDARNDDIRKDLNRSLADWESLVDVSFVRVRP